MVRHAGSVSDSDSDSDSASASVSASASGGEGYSGIFRIAIWICWNWWVTALEM